MVTGWKKFLKSFKKQLTKITKHVIIVKSLQESEENKKQEFLITDKSAHEFEKLRVKRFERDWLKKKSRKEIKKLKKVLDKLNWMWYNNKALKYKFKACKVQIGPWKLNNKKVQRNP